jgi:hypothetical protein
LYALYILLTIIFNYKIKYKELLFIYNMKQQKLKMKLIYPTLLQVANKVNPNSWFKLLEYTNTNYKKKRWE